ncbi:MAG: endonuclease MutS2 [Desulfobacterota bacterium]|nr:endonuclease MutS2 [Thermodesulfobacteriota bacterium]
MNDHTLKALEFDKVREFLASYAFSEGAKRRCRTILPLTDRYMVMQLIEETSEMRCEIDEHEILPLSGLHDIAHHIERAHVQNFYLEPGALVAIRETLETAAMLKKYFSGCAETRPHLYRRTSDILPLNHIMDSIRACISPQGEILDTASPALFEIRSRIRHMRHSIIKTLESMLNDEQKAYAMQDDFITLRNNRYVIPVRSDSKSVVPGVVHGQSQSKATFFIEPLPIVEMNNELQILYRDEYYEEIRILTELTSRVAAEADAIMHNLEIAETIDLIQARALLSIAMNASPAQLVSENVIDLRQCRHPILMARQIAQENQETTLPFPVAWSFDRADVVPIDILKNASISTLIITGANAGGKTVAMKTLGLFVLMTQSGLHIPAALGSVLPIFDRVFADIGDEQNIEASLSTFSSHMSQIRDIVKFANVGSLVLLDELGSGTDPSEGGALAVAILDFLRLRRCCTVVTTHLNLLKNYAYSTPDVENVSVAFDPDTYRPLYALVYGVPGFSNALAIARTIGIPDEILTKAQAYLDGSARQMGELIHGLERTHQKLIKQQQKFATILASANRYLYAVQRLYDIVKEKKERLLKNFEHEARKLLRNSEQELMQLIRSQKRRRIIRPETDVHADGAAKEIFINIKRKLHAHFPPPEHPPGETVASLDPGQIVTVTHLKQQGKVLSVDNTSKTAAIAVGSIRVKARFHELSPVAQYKPSRKRTDTVFVQNHASPSGSSRINVIGLRVDEALPLVDKAIDNALVQGTPVVEIIHGRGTGRLMQAIHEHLRQHKSVAGFEAAPSQEGGTGVTRVRLV